MYAMYVVFVIGIECDGCFARYVCYATSGVRVMYGPSGCPGVSRLPWAVSGPLGHLAPRGSRGGGGKAHQGLYVGGLRPLGPQTLGSY